MRRRDQASSYPGVPVRRRVTTSSICQAALVGDMHFHQQDRDFERLQSSGGRPGRAFGGAIMASAPMPPMC